MDITGKDVNNKNMELDVDEDLFGGDEDPLGIEDDDSLGDVFD